MLCPQVLDSFSVDRTYILFRTMGMRHLMVIDEHNHVRGIITRKDLMGFRLGETGLVLRGSLAALVIGHRIT